MEDSFLDDFRWLYRHKPWIATVIVLLFVTLLVAGIVLSADALFDLFTNLFASFLGFALGLILIVITPWFRHRHEDERKVMYDNKVMKRYYLDNHLLKLRLPSSSDTDADVYADVLFLNDGKSSLQVEDHPEQQFKATMFIRSQYFDLMTAHAGSTFINQPTVRLDDCQTRDGVTTLYTSRSNYYFHLLTNRAIDYHLRNTVSLRDIYEYGPRLTPLSESRMSNHIGVNALVFLKADKQASTYPYILLPKRGKNATVVKNGITAGVAIRIKMDTFEHGYSDHLTTTYLTSGDAVREKLIDSLLIDAKKWREKENKDGRSPVDDIRFLGLARDIYEGGKPTLFYSVMLNLTPEEFDQMAQANPDTDTVDAVVKVYIAEFESLGCKDNRLRFAALKRGKRTTATHHLHYEKNLLTNLWFYNRLH